MGKFDLACAIYAGIDFSEVVEKRLRRAYEILFKIEVKCSVTLCYLA